MKMSSNLHFTFVKCPVINSYYFTSISMSFFFIGLLVEITTYLNAERNWGRHLVKNT